MPRAGLMVGRDPFSGPVWGRGGASRNFLSGNVKGCRVENSGRIRRPWQAVRVLRESRIPAITLHVLDIGRNSVDSKLGKDAKL